MSKFGVTINDILSLFNGAQISDWATGGLTGQSVIEREIELVEEEAMDLVDAAARQQFESGIQPHYFDSICPDASGQNIITLLGDPECLEVRLLRRFGNNTFGCDQVCNDLTISDFEEFTDYTLSGNQIILGASWDGTPIVVSYRSDEFQIPSLARYVRNKVGCVLGRILYSTSGDEWKLVDYLCEDASKFEEKFSGIKKFVPSELRNLKYVNGSPFSIGIFSIRTRRV